MTATYFYKEYERGELVPRSSPVEIVENSTKTYLIRLLNYCRGLEPGTVIRVRKRSVKL